ncbi:MAG: metalloregulator ArsR/SmtB family transcription factor [Spirochaeta sp.]|nr:metalloregulator ArsR/SmtB family transcription factor [Spirochaeta sp.]
MTQSSVVQSGSARKRGRTDTSKAATTALATPASAADLCGVYSLSCTGSENELRAKIAEADGVSELFRVLADATRTRILYLLSEQELCVCDLAHLLFMTPPAVSHHLRLLRVTRLVRSRREGKQVFYTLDDEHVLTLIRTAQEHYQEDHSTEEQYRADHK